jgi:hypothetical protein
MQHVLFTKRKIRKKVRREQKKCSMSQAQVFLIFADHVSWCMLTYADIGWLLHLRDAMSRTDSQRNTLCPWRLHDIFFYTLDILYCIFSVTFPNMSSHGDRVNTKVFSYGTRLHVFITVRPITLILKPGKGQNYFGRGVMKTHNYSLRDQARGNTERGMRTHTAGFPEIAFE